MNILKVYILFFLLTCTVDLLQAQESVFTAFKSDTKKGDQRFEAHLYQSALPYYLKAYKKSKGDNLLYKIAYSYQMTGQLKESSEWYKKADSSGAKLPEDFKLNYAKLLEAIGEHSLSKKYYQEYYLSIGKEYKYIDHSAETLYSDSLHYSVFNLNINSKQNEYSPIFYQKGLVFVSDRATHDLIKRTGDDGSTYFSNVYYAESNTDSLFLQPELFDKTFRSMTHEGPVFFYHNGERAIVSKNYNRPNSQGVRNLGLYFFEKKESGEWKSKEAFVYNDVNYSITHPSYSEKDSVLYFISDMPGGYGGTDIYKSQYQNGRWSAPVNLGQEINTIQDEFFPYVYKDSLLFFSSEGHKGLGHLDIYYTRLVDSKTHIINPGYPLNGPADDFGMILNETGELGYFVSNRNGTDDLFGVKHNYLFVDIAIKELINGKPLTDIEVAVRENGKLIKELYLADLDRYKDKLKPGKDYIVTFSKKDYKSKSIDLHSYQKASVTYSSTVLLERKNKLFLVGVVKDHKNNILKNCMVVLHDDANQKRDTVYSDEKGEYNIEIDPDVENLLVANDSIKIGVKKIATQVSKKGMVALKADILVGNYSLNTFKGIVLDSITKTPAVNAQLLLINKTTGEIKPLLTDYYGKFQLETISIMDYEIYPVCMEKKGLPLKINQSADKGKLITLYCDCNYSVHHTE